jgi:hypothetical protein
MPGLVPGIHDLEPARGADVDGRDKPGHDEANCARSSGYLTPSFFCRLDDDVVYWKISFLSG